MNIPTTICPSCFTNKGDVSVCASCGYDENERRSPLVLPHRTVLHGQYLVGKVLGKPGGFGITYLAMDLKLKVKVAIKEYLPRDLAGRDSNHSTVYPHSKEDAEFFAKGLDDFLKEAQNLAQFDHANIVRVRNFFKENDTAYIVMDYYDGITLHEYVQRMGGKVEWQMAIKIMTPIMDALREVHAKGFLHRDIKPHNIYLTRENRIILLDFGSARQAMGERSKSLSMVLTPGYAPFEQYHRRGNQGPWTDVYGVAATLYFMIMGEAPPEANERVERDNIQLPSQFMIALPQSVERGLMKGLAVKAAERFENVRSFQDGLISSSGLDSLVRPQKKPIPKVIPPTVKTEIKLDSPFTFRNFAILGIVVIIAVVFVLQLSKINQHDKGIETPARESQLPVAPTPYQEPTQLKPVEPTTAYRGDPHAGMPAQEIPAGGGLGGIVVEKMDSGGYTYVQVLNVRGDQVWLALPEIRVAVGDKIEYPETPPLTNFQSKSLNKTFEKISFIPGIRIVR